MKDIIHPKIWIISNDTSRKEKKEKERKTPVIPLFSSGNSSLLYPSILDTRLYTPRSHYRGREGKERREGRKAARGKENLADPFYPPRSGSKSREPLSHRLLDACKYPWQRGTTMRGDPRRELFLRISGWSALPKISRRKRERGGSLWEKFPFDPRPIPPIAALFLNSFPLS